MENRGCSGGPSRPETKDDIERRLRGISVAIARQREIIEDIEREGHTAAGAKTLLRLFQEERMALSQQLEPNPDSNLSSSEYPNPGG